MSFPFSGKKSRKTQVYILFMYTHTQHDNKKVYVLPVYLIHVELLGSIAGACIRFTKQARLLRVQNGSIVVI